MGRRAATLFIAFAGLVAHANSGFAQKPSVSTSSPAVDAAKTEAPPAKSRRRRRKPRPRPHPAKLYQIRRPTEAFRVELPPTSRYSLRPQVAWSRPPLPIAQRNSAADDRTVSSGQVWSEALVAVLWVLTFAFAGLRAVAWTVRRLGDRGVHIAQLAVRGWRLVEGVVWIGVSLWVLNRLATGPGWGPAALATGVLLLVIILTFNSIRDAVSGLLLNLERPFDVGDYVRVGEAEGQVSAFRTRVVELIAPNGHRLLVPYRALAGTADVRPGGRRRAYAVRVELSVPTGVDPMEAVALAEEVARASPWAALGSDPRITVDQPPLALIVEAFAFEPGAQVLLQAELLRSWGQVCRRWQ